MPDFLINVRSRWDASSVRQYAQEVTAAIRRIEAEAARGGPARRPQTQAVVQREQARAEAGLTGIASSGLLGERYEPFARSIRGQFERLSRVYGVELLRGAQLNTALESHAVATRSTVASERALRDATAEAAVARTRAATASAAAARSEATAASRAQAALGRRGLEYREGESPGARQARVDAKDKADKAEARLSVENLAQARETARLRARYNAELRRTTAQARAAANAEFAADLGPGTRAQRFQAVIARRQGQEPRPAASFPTGPQLLGSGLLTSARFAVGGALLYGGLQTITEMVQQASELERIFNQIDRQFQEVNQTGEGGAFKRSILEISKDTGVMAKDVAFVAFQMKGAFDDTTTAVEATDDAIKVARVTGLDLNEIVDSLVAGSKSFGISIGEVGDEALGLQERFGVLARESIKVFGDLGPAAAAAGLDIRETGALVAAVQQVSARSGGTIAENLGRVLPSVQKSAGELMRIYQSNPALQGRLPVVSQALGEGRTGDVLLALVQDYDKLTEAQRKNLVSALGGERNAATLNALFNSRAAILKELERGEADLGKTEAYFADLQDTLAQGASRAKAEFVAFGLALFESGLGDILKDLVNVGGGVIKVLGTMAEGFAFLNDATAGVGIKLLEIYATLRLISALRASGAGQAIGAFLGVGAGRGAPNVYRNMAGQLVVEQAAGGLLGGLSTRYAAGRTAAAASTSVLARVPGYTTAAGGVAALGGAPALAVLGGAAVLKVRQELLERNQTEADRFTKELKKATDDELDKMLAGQESLLDRIRQAIGFETSKSLRDREVGLRRISRPVAPGVSGRDELEAARDAGLLEGTDLGGPAAVIATATRGIPGIGALTRGLSDRVDVAELTKRALEGDLKAVEEVQRQIAAAKADPAKRVQLEKKLGELKNRYKIDQARAAVESNDLVNDLQEAKSLYDAGQISVAEYMDQLAAKAAELDSLLASGALEADPALKAKAEQDRATIAKSQAQLESELARKIVDYNLQNQELAGRGGPEQTVTALTGLLQDPKVTDRSVREKATQDLLGALKEQLQQEADLVDSAVDRARILREGLPVPEAVRVQLVQEQVRALDADFLRFLDTVAQGPEEAAALLEEVATRAVRDSITLADAMRAIMAEKINRLAGEIATLATGAIFGQGDPARMAQAIEEVTRLREQYTQPIPEARAQVPTDRVRATAVEQHRADEAAREEQRATARARLAYRKAQAEGDPVAQARIGIQEAEFAVSIAKTQAERFEALAQQVSSQRALSLALVEVADAYRSVDRALAEAAGDTVRIAELEIEAAEAHLAAARERGDVLGQLAAQAQIITAQAALSRARLQVGDAYRNLDRALAEAAGDTVRVAQLEIEQAEAHLAAAQQRGDLLGSLEAQAQVVAAQAGRVNAEVQAREERINTALALEQITTQQAIAEYEAILQIPGLTRQQVDQMLVKIHQLRKELTKDAAFNIPSEIRLPTLYEVRRANQTGGPLSGGYQDNRQIVINFTANNTADAEGIANRIVDGFGRPSRFGATPRSY